ncbi:MAG: histidine kinase dimerization/phospho-acceptor domain-containing protein, partial [bacterium]
MNKQVVEQSRANPQRLMDKPCTGLGVFTEADSNKNESDDMSLFVGITQQLAHDIRNVLGCMNGFVTLLRRDLEQNPECIHLLQKIRKGSNRLEQIVEDLALFSQQKTHYLAEIDMDTALEQAIQFCQANMKEHFREIEILWTPTSKDVHVFLNIELFSRLLYVAVATLFKNLVNGKEINISTRMQTAEGFVRLSLTAVDHSMHSTSYSSESRLYNEQNQRPFNHVVICKILQMLNGKLERVVLHGSKLCIVFSVPYTSDLII